MLVRHLSWQHPISQLVSQCCLLTKSPKVWRSIFSFWLPVFLVVWLSWSLFRCVLVHKLYIWQFKESFSIILKLLRGSTQHNVKVRRQFSFLTNYNPRTCFKFLLQASSGLHVLPMPQCVSTTGCVLPGYDSVSLKQVNQRKMNPGFKPSGRRKCWNVYVHGAFMIVVNHKS